jgi:mannose-6-phosphate isomerase-like protein (cupin superfamily)
MSGVECTKIICTRVPKGCGGPDLHVHPVDQYYYVLKGKMHFQLGDEQFVLGPDTAVTIPAGTPHRNWNENDETEMHLEIFCPPAPAGILQKVQPRRIENAASYIRQVDPSKWNVKPTRKTQDLIRRDLGDSGTARVYIAETGPGMGGPKLHFHRFDQFYYILEGELTIQIGLDKMVAGPDSLVVLPAGVLHTNTNDGKSLLRHLTFLVPEPKVAGTNDFRVELVKE